MADDVDQNPDENGKAKFDEIIVKSSDLPYPKIPKMGGGSKCCRENRFWWSGAYTHASLEMVGLPDAFTFCTSYMVIILFFQISICASYMAFVFFFLNMLDKLHNIHPMTFPNSLHMTNQMLSFSLFKGSSLDDWVPSCRSLPHQWPRRSEVKMTILMTNKAVKTMI